MHLPSGNVMIRELNYDVEKYNPWLYLRQIHAQDWSKWYKWNFRINFYMFRHAGTVKGNKPFDYKYTWYPWLGILSVFTYKGPIKTACICKENIKRIKLYKAILSPPPCPLRESMVKYIK